MSVSCEFCVLSSRSACDEIIPYPEKPFDCGVSECDSEPSMRRPWSIRDCYVFRKKQDRQCTCNIEACSSNDFCSGKATSITYYECVFVPLGTQCEIRDIVTWPFQL
jgi:hypothetical protein